jgi:hypothetical protein
LLDMIASPQTVLRGRFGDVRGLAGEDGGQGVLEDVELPRASDLCHPRADPEA